MEIKDRDFMAEFLEFKDEVEEFGHLGPNFYNTFAYHA